MITITEVPGEPAVSIRGARLAWHPDEAASRIVSHPFALSLFLRWFCGSIMAAESVSADSAACTRTEGGGEGDESTAFFEAPSQRRRRQQLEKEKVKAASGDGGLLYFGDSIGSRVHLDTYIEIRPAHLVGECRSKLNSTSSLVSERASRGILLSPKGTAVFLSNL